MKYILAVMALFNIFLFYQIISTNSNVLSNTIELMDIRLKIWHLEYPKIDPS